MDKMHWMEASIATREQESNTLETIGFPSMVPSVAFFQSKDVTDVGHIAQHPSQHPTAQCPAPACASHDQQYLLAPFPQPDSYDGSLNDMLVPYQYDKLLDELLSEQDEPLVLQLAPIAQFERSPLCHRNIHLSNGYSNIILNYDAVSANDDIELASAISKSHHDAKNAMMVSSLPPITPMPALSTGRPPMRKGTVSYRKNHIHTERQRWQEMTSLFNRLKSVLPNSYMQHDDLKGDRCTILEHVIDYVQELDKKVQVLGKTKAELMQGEEGAFNHHHHRRLAQQAALASADTVSVRPWGHVDIFITLNCPKHRGLWPNLLALLQDTLQLDVQNVALSSTPLFWVHSIYAKVLGDDSEEVCCKVKNTLREFVTDHAYSNYLMR